MLKCPHKNDTIQSEINTVFNEKFIELRKEKKLSQARLAEKLYVPISTIRNWERKKSIPSIGDMKKIAKILSVSEQIIVTIFEPEKTNVSGQREEELKIHNLLIELFWGCNNIEHFLKFAYLFSISHSSGVILCQDYVFPFITVVADQNGLAAVFADSSENYVVLTVMNIIEAIPISVDYDIFTFDIFTSSPMFPTNIKYSPYSFKQKIRVSFFNR